MRTDREQVSGRDVTREFYDNEAHLRNLRAEEQQYLAIMKQAHTVPDMLEVSEKLSDVRDRIERLQAQIQVMTHDIEMSAVSITPGAGVRHSGTWHPVAAVVQRENCDSRAAGRPGRVDGLGGGAPHQAAADPAVDADCRCDVMDRLEDWPGSVGAVGQSERRRHIIITQGGTTYSLVNPPADWFCRGKARLFILFTSRGTNECIVLWLKN